MKKTTTWHETAPSAQGRDLPSLLRVEQLAAALSVGPHAVTAWIRKGLLSASRPGRFFILTREDVLAFLDRHRIVPRGPAANPPDTARFLRGVPPPRRVKHLPDPRPRP